MAEIRVTRTVRIPEHELEFRTARAGGPGGQGVNTTDSKVELRFQLADSPYLTAEQEALARRRLSNRLTNDGILIVRASGRRSQQRNRRAAIYRFRELLAEAIAPPKPRRRTRPSRGARRRRLADKRHRSEIKRLRRDPEIPRE